MNLRDINYVLAVAKYQHFGKAAAACFVSQPTLSAQIKKLEEELGIPLFERNNKRVLLRPEAKTILQQMQSVNNTIKNIKDSAKILQQPNSTHLNIGVIPTLGPYLLPRILTVLKTQFAKVEFHWFEDQTTVVMTKLHRGELDAVILALPLDTEGLEVYSLFHEPFLAALPKQHRLSKDKILNIKQIPNNELLLLAEGHCLRGQALEACRLKDNGQYQATSLETLYQMVLAAQGITLLPQLATLGRTKISLKPLYPKATREIAMLWRNTSIYPKLLEKIAAQIKQTINSIL